MTSKKRHTGELTRLCSTHSQAWLRTEASEDQSCDLCDAHGEIGWLRAIILLLAVVVMVQAINIREKRKIIEVYSTTISETTELLKAIGEE